MMDKINVIIIHTIEIKTPGFPNSLKFNHSHLLKVVPLICHYKVIWYHTNSTKSKGLVASQSASHLMLQRIKFDQTAGNFKIIR